MYDVDYFIKKFAAIPDEDWTTRKFVNDLGQCCALGHCGSRTMPKGLYSVHSRESTSLRDILLNEVVEINDGRHGQYQQETPKARILAALRDIEGKSDAGNE